MSRSWPNKQQGYFLLSFIQLLIKELIPVDVFARATAPISSPASAQGAEPVRGIIHTPFANISAEIQIIVAGALSVIPKLSGHAESAMLPCA